MRTKSHPEASIANGYAAEEALGFCTEYLNLQAYTKRHVWETAEDEGTKGSVVQGRGRVVTLTQASVARAHNYVIDHHECTLDMRR